MRWAQLLSPARLGSRKHHTEQARSPFHKDYDRIIFSQSFRQLNRKTQVHPLTQNDAVHTRLTHSLEVSSVGRSLGMLAAEKIADDLPPWVTPSDVGAIIQAACLAHDIGNPPYGHAGEYAVRDWFGQPKQEHLMSLLSSPEFSDLCQYEGNAQGFRILTRLEYHPNEGGMRLTYATLGAFLKYPRLAAPLEAQAGQPSHKRTKFGCYQSERELLDEVAEHLGLIRLSESSYCRHPLAYLLEAADDICYALIDLEDGLLLGMLHYSDVEPLFLKLIGDYGTPHEVLNDVPIAQKLAALRGRAMKRLVEEVSEAFKRKQSDLLRGTLQGSLLDHCPRDIAEGIEAAKNLTRTRIFTNPQKARLELVASASLHVLLGALMPLALDRERETFREHRLLVILKHHGATLGLDPYQNMMQILDVISALSDHQAYALAQDIKGNRGNMGY
ncbi:deoxyguanosinetriphosphate triphosphohydrolase [Aquirhabdus parva]|uniref:Deoxyguanosinetriphosphate triphosphohydrolase n=1 Tax=Aquirhabdus parva TaxID=2283318 RepID=A0A345P5D8_9GAMM|nr:deoxyguanosinetriphosphate triphosphohydrolase [Aquirhabdus parva]AXI02497.1 deoxyguanosinetriphosphate triphosphohydrolase [Aquirhabdus parva]